MFFKIFVLFLIVRGSVSEGETECSVDDSIYKRFAAKTAYSMVRGNLPDEGTTITDCSPVKVWLLSRDGAAYPSKSIIEGLEELLEDVRKDIPESSPSACKQLNEWNLTDISENVYDSLSDEGSKELSELALRYKATFSELFNPIENFLCQYAAEKRTNDSYQAFVTALFPDNSINVNVTYTEKEDKMLKFYEQCNKWVENNGAEDGSESESSKFEKSANFTEVINNIKTKFGLTRNLSNSDVDKIWDMCRYNKAWNNDQDYLSPWCIAFEKEDIDVLEYRDDLKSYYKTGYGKDINSRVACKPIADMLNHLENIDSFAEHKVIAYFADETTFQLFLTALEVDKEKDEKLKSDNFGAMQERKWKLSEISPFASNLAVVKYECENEVEAKVKFFLNEKLLKFDWCNPKDLCTVDQVLDHYKDFKNADCNNYYCSGKAKIVYGAFYIVSALILIYLY